MIRAVIAGIKSAYTTYKAANPTKALALVTGFYFMQAPQGATGDYVVFRLLPGGKPDPDMSATVEVIPVQFDIFAVDKSGRHNSTYALEVAEQLITVYDDTAIAVVSGATTLGTTYRCDRQTKPNIEPDPDGGWHCWVDYILQVQEV